ncbi:MAG: hypothetical protein D6680_15685 [Cyanobacteria bacterium J007]|nr:MAG: hypothetical protein D6680_15685 [Cyanobacteria bacterium J007]
MLLLCANSAWIEGRIFARKLKRSRENSALALRTKFMTNPDKKLHKIGTLESLKRSQIEVA